MVNLGRIMDTSTRIRGETSSAAFSAAQRFRALPAWFLTKDGYWLYCRLIQREDALRLLDFFEQLSSQTRQLRFHANVDHLDAGITAYHAHNFANVDNLHTGGAVVAVDFRGGAQQVVGVMRLSAPEDGWAEVAVVVRDDFQGRGVGRALLQRLPTLAQRMGVHTVIATIDAANLPALRLMRQLDYPVTARTSHAQTELHIQLSSRQSSTHTDLV